MKATPLLKVEDNTLRFMIDELSFYRQGLSETERNLFDLGFSKVVHARQFVELDSMEMILISKALKQLSIQYFIENKSDMRGIRQKLINLAHEIDLERIKHQQIHHPLKKRTDRIGRDQLKRKTKLITYVRLYIFQLYMAIPSFARLCRWVHIAVTV